MIKGARKQMIVIRTGNSRYFNEAYFVLRNDWKECPEAQNDMLHEANRILAESANQAAKKEKKHLMQWMCFVAGGICGGALAVLVCILLL